MPRFVFLNRILTCLGFLPAILVSVFILPSWALGTPYKSRALDACSALLVNHKSLPLTANAREVRAVDYNSWSLQAAIDHLGQAISYQGWINYTKPETVGPVRLYKFKDFALYRRLIMLKLMTASKQYDFLKKAEENAFEAIKKEDLSIAELLEGYSKSDDSVKEVIKVRRDPESWRKQAKESVKNGIEVGLWIFKLKSGQIIESEVSTSFLAGNIEVVESFNKVAQDHHIKYEDVEEIEFYHTHPHTHPRAALLSLADIKATHYFADLFMKNGSFPKLHIYAIASNIGFDIVAHYGIQLTENKRDEK